MNFTEAEIRCMIDSLKHEYGIEIATRELAILELEDMKRKGCLFENEYSDSCIGCSAFAKGECPMLDWEKRHPEYKDDALAKRLKELRDQAAGVQRAEITKRLLEKGYVKVQWKQWNDERTTSAPKLYLPGSAELKADLMDAVENWKNMWGEDFRLRTVNLNARKGVLLELYVNGSDENEIWEVID